MIRRHLLQTTQQFCWNTTQHQKSDEHVKHISKTIILKTKHHNKLIKIDK